MKMASEEKTCEIIQYNPFKSFVHPSFWHKLTDFKLNVDKLNETSKQIYGRFSYKYDIFTNTGVFEVDGTSFNKKPESELLHIDVTGTLMNKNTIEDFKSIDKTALLNSVGEIIWANIKMLTWIEKPDSLLNFFILSFADLKKFHYYYWFAFPCPSQPTVCLTEKRRTIRTQFTHKELRDLSESYKSLELDQKCYFVIIKENDTLMIKKLSDFLNKDQTEEDINIDESVYFAFADQSNHKNPGWPLRIFLAALFECFPKFAKGPIQVIGIRCAKDGSLESSQLLKIEAQENTQPGNVSWLGWERNDKGNFGPKVANMSSSMDPVKLADTASDLNVKLMQWRLVPDLNVDVMKQTKCLLLGAGTLGCHVARDLLAWGFRHITFIDNGKVSYSNPTRQVLFTFQDCQKGRKKAKAAADNLRLILPTVISEGITLHIPMPGHPIGESLTNETMENVRVLTEAITNHDVIFLLLDSREARWLPTLIAACHGKIVINAALGFDSYLVMRHGVSKDRNEPDGTSEPVECSSKSETHVEGGSLGCYFCNDVTAPGNSLKDRTLDQQCTVTRPGVAAIAGALSVELLVAILQHPLRIHASALHNLNSEDNTKYEGILGPIPHSIRGFLNSFQTIVPTCSKFKQCIACSEVVIDKYRQEGMEFLMKVFNSGTFLEDVTGLSELHLAAEMTDILTFSDEENSV